MNERKNEQQTIRVIHFNKYTVTLLLIVFILGIVQFVQMAIDIVAWLVN